MVMGNPSTCTQAIKLMVFLIEFLKATHPTTHQRLRQSTLAVLLIEEGIKPKEEEGSKLSRLFKSRITKNVIDHHPFSKLLFREKISILVTRTATFLSFCSFGRGYNSCQYRYELIIFSSPARSAQSYCCHLGRPRLRPRPRHTSG